MRSWTCLAVASGLLIAGCAEVGSPPAPPLRAGPPLVGTEWRLLHFESSEDSIGTIRPAPDEVYTLQLNEDGSAALGLFCNRGTGRWTSADRKRPRGSLEIEALGVTMAACPPSPLERLSSDLARIRSFVIADGRLHLNLKLDSGNYVWEESR